MKCWCGAKESNQPKTYCTNGHFFERTSPDVGIRARIKMERRIVKATVKDLLDAGYLVQASYERGFDDVMKPSTDLAEVMKNLMVSDEEWLMVYDPSEMDGESHEVHEDRPQAAVTLVYGNDGYDVVSDYYVSLEPAMKKSLALAERLAG